LAQQKTNKSNSSKAEASQGKDLLKMTGEQVKLAKKAVKYL
jgi:hypothetical protein